MPRCLPILASFFYWFLIDFYSQLGPSNLENSCSHSCGSMNFQKSPFEVSIDFLFDLGANLPPFFLPKSTKIVSKSDLERHRFFDRFLHRFFIDFCSLGEANLEPFWRHFRSKWGGELEASLFFVGSMLFFDFLAVLAPSWPNFGSILEGLGLHFGGFWAPFWRFLVTIWVACGL